jgi:hypothetical protein
MRSSGRGGTGLPYGDGDSHSTVLFFLCLQHNSAYDQEKPFDGAEHTEHTEHTIALVAEGLEMYGALKYPRSSSTPRSVKSLHGRGNSNGTSADTDDDFDGAAVPNLMAGQAELDISRDQLEGRDIPQAVPLEPVVPASIAAAMPLSSGPYIRMSDIRSKLISHLPHALSTWQG